MMNQHLKLLMIVLICAPKLNARSVKRSPTSWTTSSCKSTEPPRASQADAVPSKLVEIQISPTDLATLKTCGYRLCFAKKVGDTYNVVWKSYTEYLGFNEFSWTPVYQLFGTNRFYPGLKVRVQTNAVDIKLAQSATLTPAGNLGDVNSGGSLTSISLINDYGTIRPGVSQSSTGIDGKTTITPIYVGDPIVKGVDVIEPKESVMVWFEKNVETSSIFAFSHAYSRVVEIDLTRRNSVTYRYSNQTWRKI